MITVSKRTLQIILTLSNHKYWIVKPGLELRRISYLQQNPFTCKPYYII